MKEINYNFIFLLIILISFSCCNKNNKIFRKLDPPQESLNEEKERLENDYQNKLKENIFLNQQIEKNLKYIRILLTSGIIMFSIIIYISIKIYLKKKQNKKKSKIKIDKINDSNINKNENIQESEISNISSINSSIDKSNYNLFNNSNNNNQEEKDYDNSNNNNQEEKNYDAPKIANFSNVEIEINDDNKTLTNNPDLFVPSRMDRILYRPYSKEEIK